MTIIIRWDNDDNHAQMPIIHFIKLNGAIGVFNVPLNFGRRETQ